MTRGEIQVARLGRGHRPVAPPGWRLINVCSHSKDVLDGAPMRDLSPFFLGPVEVTEDGVRKRALNLENLWQVGKVWKGETERDLPAAAVAATQDGEARRREVAAAHGLAAADFAPNADWWARRARYWADPKAHRHVRRGRPLYAWWQGEPLGYVEARGKVYCPAYERLARATAAYAALEALVASGQSVLLVGYDGYRLERPLADYFADPGKIFGHELVLAAMLRGEAPWADAFPGAARTWADQAPKRPRARK